MDVELGPPVEKGASLSAEGFRLSPIVPKDILHPPPSALSPKLSKEVSSTKATVPQHKAGPVEATVPQPKTGHVEATAPQHTTGPVGVPEVSGSNEPFAGVKATSPVAVSPAVTDSQEATSSKKNNGNERGKWSNQIQFILTCIGYAVGLGNIWRFPKLAYENGGSAFLIPFYFCMIFFGLPGLYFEYVMGQYTASGAPTAFSMYAPIMEGIGWAMAFVSVSISVYYNVIISWALLYIYKTIEMLITGKGFEWSSCRNEWNTGSCLSEIDNLACREANSSLQFYFNKACHNVDSRKLLLANHSEETTIATEEFFNNYLLETTSGIAVFGGLNWKILIALVIVWIITALCMMFGVKIVGKVSYITATVPYIILAALFIRGVTLPGSSEGLRYYLMKPDFSKILTFKTWSVALSQVCYSLNVGLGGLLSMSSYNERNHNCFKDAIIVVFADSCMSVFGGLAAFSILGYLAHEQNRSVQDVITTGPGLVFIAYPEAMSQMSVGWLWSLIFFIMIFMLGISSQFGLVEVVVTSFVESNSRGLGKKVICPLVCLAGFILGICMCFKSGIYWFTLLDTYAGIIGMTICGVLEFGGICYIYGLKNFREDIREMLGTPEGEVKSFMGSSGWYFAINWAVLAPLVGTTIAIVTFVEMLNTITIGKYHFPKWTIAVGCLLGLAPLLAVPIVAFRKFYKLQAEGKNTDSLWLPQSTLPSYLRIKSNQAKREQQKQDNARVKF